MKKTFLVALATIGWFLLAPAGAQNLQAYQVRGVVRICDTGDIAKWGANIPCVYCPFTAKLRLTTSPYTQYTTTSPVCPPGADADVIWNGIPAGTYTVKAQSQCIGDHSYSTPSDCIFTITVTDHDLNFVDPKVRYTPCTSGPELP